MGWVGRWRRAGGREMYTSNGGSKGVAGRALDMLVFCFSPMQ